MENPVPSSIKLQKLSKVAGHAIISPENPLEAAQENHTTKQYHHALDQAAAADTLKREYGDHHQDERKPLKPVSHDLPCYLLIQREQEYQESAIGVTSELQPEPQKDDGQTDLMIKISEEDLHSPAASLTGGFMYTDNDEEDPFVVNSIGVEPLHQNLEDLNHHRVNGVQSDTAFYNLGKPGDDADLLLLFGRLSLS